MPHPKPERNIFLHGAPWEKLIMLKHIANIGKRAAKRGTVIKHAPVSRLKKTGYYGKYGGFSASGAAHDADKFIFIYRERNAFKGLNLAGGSIVFHGYIFKLYELIAAAARRLYGGQRKKNCIFGIQIISHTFRGPGKTGRHKPGLAYGIVICMAAE